MKTTNQIGVIFAAHSKDGAKQITFGQCFPSVEIATDFLSEVYVIIDELPFQMDCRTLFYQNGKNCYVEWYQKGLDLSDSYLTVYQKNEEGLWEDPNTDGKPKKTKPKMPKHFGFDNKKMLLFYKHTIIKEFLNNKIELLFDGFSIEEING